MADTNFTILQGEYWSYDLTVTKDGTALDLDDWTVYGSIRPSHWTSDKIADITFTTTDADAGETTMSLSATDTAKLPYSGTEKPVYDVVVKNTNASHGSFGQVIRILEGLITVDPRATLV